MKVSIEEVAKMEARLKKSRKKVTKFQVRLESKKSKLKQREDDFEAAKRRLGLRNFKMAPPAMHLTGVVEGEESTVQKAVVKLLSELCAEAGLRLEETCERPVRGCVRRPTACVLVEGALLSLSEAKVTVELREKGMLLEARDYVQECLCDQALLDADEHREEYLGIACDGSDVQVCRLVSKGEGEGWQFTSNNFSLWEKDVVGGSVDSYTYQTLFLVLCRAKKLPNRTTVERCSELRSLISSKDARFGVLSLGKPDHGEDKHSPVVYWSDHDGGVILKEYVKEKYAEREWKAAVRARESLPEHMKHHVSMVERLGGEKDKEDNNNDNNGAEEKKFWLKLTPVGLCSLGECGWLFGLLPANATEEQKVDLFMALKGHFETVEAVLLALHEKKVFHCNVKPSHIVLMHKDDGLTEVSLVKTLVPMLIDFVSLGNEIRRMELFASRRLLLSRSDPRSNDDLESLFWTAVEVLSKGTFIRMLHGMVLEERKRWSTLQRFTSELIIDCRRAFLAELEKDKRDGRLANMLFLFEHSFEYLQGLAKKRDLHRKYKKRMFGE